MTSWLIVAIVALVVVGPKNLPSAVRKMARTLGKLQRASDSFKRQLMSLEEEVEREAESTVGEAGEMHESGHVR